MQKEGKKSILTKGTVLSIVLHLVVIGFVVFWGVGKHNEQSGTIEVSLSSGDFGGGGSGNTNDEQKEIKQKKDEQSVKKQEDKEAVKSKEPEKKVEKEVVKKEEPKEKIVEKKEEETEKIPEKVVKEKEEPKKELIKEKEVVIPEKKVEKEVAKKEEKVEESKPEKKTEEKTAEKEEVKKEEIQSETKPEEKVAETGSSENKTVSSKDDILKEIKRNAVLKDLKKDSAVGNPKEVAENSPQGFGSGEGSSQGNSGGSSSRIGSAINPIVLSTYYEVLSKRVERVLAFPPSIELDGSYTTLVRFWMNDNGRVYNVAVDKTSGSNVIDSYCLKAVNSAAPFPSPPAELQSRIKVEPFVIPCKNDG